MGVHCLWAWDATLWGGQARAVSPATRICRPCDLGQVTAPSRSLCLDVKMEASGGQRWSPPGAQHRADAQPHGTPFPAARCHVAWSDMPHPWRGLLQSCPHSQPHGPRGDPHCPANTLVWNQFMFPNPVMVASYCLNKDANLSEQLTKRCFGTPGWRSG